MKKILALAIVVAMLASLSVGAAAAVTADGTGGIRFGLFGPGQYPPDVGGHNPLPETQNPFPGPDEVWPPFPEIPDPTDPTNSIPVRQPTQMDSWELDFGSREMPTGAHRRVGWASAPHADWATLPNMPIGGRPLPEPAPDSGIYNPFTNAYVNYSRLGLLWNEGASATASPPPYYQILPDADVVITVARSHFYVDGIPAAAPPLLSARTLQGFTLTLRTSFAPGYLNMHNLRTVAGTSPGFHPAGTSLAGGTVSAFTRPGVTVIEATPLVTTATNPGEILVADAAEVVRFQTGFVGIEWAGLLEGNWNGTNIAPGHAQADILFTGTVTVI